MQRTVRCALPLRPCVGIVLFNAQGLVWVGRRRPKWARSEATSATLWQLPQGGIEPREPSREAAFRELREETGVRNASLLAEIPGWLSYELPPDLLGIALKGKYGGQRLRWYAMRFEGDDERDRHRPQGRDEIGVRRLAVGARSTDVPSLAVDFRRPVYEEVVQEFAHYARAGAQRRMRAIQTAAALGGLRLQTLQEIDQRFGHHLRLIVLGLGDLRLGGFQLAGEPAPRRARPPARPSAPARSGAPGRPRRRPS